MSKSCSTGIACTEYYGVQKYRFKLATLSNYLDKKCHEHCNFKNMVATGDNILCPI